MKRKNVNQYRKVIGVGMVVLSLVWGGYTTVPALAQGSSDSGQNMPKEGVSQEACIWEDSELSVSGNSVSGGDLIDALSPHIRLEGSSGWYDAGLYVGGCGMSMTFSITDEMGCEHSRQTSSENVSGLIYEYDGKRYECPVSEGRAEIVFRDELSAQVRFYCVDRAGNLSNIIETYVVVESSAPQITAERRIDPLSGEVMVDIRVSDTGKVCSGISEIRCWLDGEEFILGDKETEADVSGGDPVQTDGNNLLFTIPLPNDGETHRISVSAWDKAGNQAQAHYEAQSMNDVLVSLPEEFKLYINTEYISRQRQIWSEEIPIENLTECDVLVSIADVEIEINTDNEEKVPKNCNLKLEIIPENPETDEELHQGLFKASGEKLLIEDGQQDVSEFTLERKKDGEPGGRAVLKITGSVSEGTEKLWRDGDLMVKITFEYHLDPAEEEETEAVLLEEVTEEEVAILQ